MLTLSEILASICKLKNLGISWDYVRTSITEENIRYILDTPIHSKNIQMEKNYQCALVYDSLFNWQKDLNQNNIYLLNELVDTFKVLNIPLRNINKNNLKCIAKVDYSLYSLNNFVFDLSFNKNLLANLLTLDISKPLFKKLFTSLCQKDSNSLDFSFLKLIPLEKLECIQYFKYFSIKKTDDFMRLFEILKLEENMKFFRYILYKKYLLLFSRNIDDYFKELHIESDRLSIVHNIESILDYNNSKMTLQHFDSINFNYEQMAIFLNNIKNKYYYIKDYNGIQIYSLMLDPKYHPLLNLNYSPNISDLISYCINNNKWSFLQLINFNLDWFNSRNGDELIFSSVFRKLVDLNSLTFDNLMQTSIKIDKSMLKTISSTNLRNFHFSEFMFFYCCDDLGLTNYLLNIFENLDANTNDKIIILKELKDIPNIREILRPFYYKTYHFKELANDLSVKPLSSWLNEFSYIEGIDKLLCLRILNSKYLLNPYLKDIFNKDELEFFLNNIDNESLFQLPLDEIRNQIINSNTDNTKLFDLLKLTESFLEKNKSSIVSFCLRRLASKSLKYYRNTILTPQQKKGFFSIIKLELCKHLYKVKYQDTNLIKELGVEITNKQKSMWIKNIDISINDIEIKECDTFEITFNHKPIYYERNSSNIYFIPFLDSTYKKAYYINNGRVEGEAVIRLVKTSNTYSDSKLFEKNKSNENLSLFLERPFISYNCQNHKEVFQGLIKLALNKSQTTEIPLLLSKSYIDFIEDTKNYKEFETYIFINKSKSPIIFWPDISYKPLHFEKGSYLPILVYKYNS